MSVHFSVRASVQRTTFSGTVSVQTSARASAVLGFGPSFLAGPRGGSRFRYSGSEVRSGGSSGPSCPADPGSDGSRVPSGGLSEPGARRIGAALFETVMASFSYAFVFQEYFGQCLFSDSVVVSYDTTCPRTSALTSKAFKCVSDGVFAT